MGFASKEISGLFKVLIYGILGLVVVYLFLNLLPYVVLIGLVSWFGYKMFKTVKKWTTKNDTVINNKSNMDYSTMDSAEEYTNGEIIDVDYKEVK